MLFLLHYAPCLLNLPQRRKHKALARHLPRLFPKSLCRVELQYLIFQDKRHFGDALFDLLCGELHQPHPFSSGSYSLSLHSGDRRWLLLRAWIVAHGL